MSPQSKLSRLLSLAALLALTLPVSIAGAENRAAKALEGAETVTLPQARLQASESLDDLLARKASAAELFAHPDWIAAEKLVDGRAAVETADTYATPEAKAKRPFIFGGEEVVGYDAALPRLVAVAKAFAPDGQAAADKHAVLLIGGPGSGKSTLAVKIAIRDRAGIVDADLAKEALPEYQDGLGTQAVHRESAEIAVLLANEFTLRGENFIWPRTGRSVEGIRHIAETLKDQGYSVDLISVDVSEDEAARRVVKRFLETGRMVQARFLKGSRNRAHATYEELKRDGAADRYAEVDSTEGWPWRVVQDGEAVSGLLGGDGASVRRGGPQLDAAEAAQEDAQAHLEIPDFLSTIQGTDKSPRHELTSSP